MNQNELNEMSALVQRRLKIKALLRESIERRLAPDEREALEQLLEEKTEHYLRLEDAVGRLSDQLASLETSAHERGRIQTMESKLTELGDAVRRLRRVFHPESLGEVYSAALVDPYADEALPLGQRVAVPAGDL